MSQGNGTFARAKLFCVSGVALGPKDSATVRTAGAEIFTEVAETPAQAEVAARFAAGRPYQSDRPTLMEMLDTLTGAKHRVAEYAIRHAAALFVSIDPNPIPPDPLLEDLIMKQVARRVEAEAVANLALDKLVALHVKARQLEVRAANERDDDSRAVMVAEIERLKAEERLVVAERDDAHRAAEREASRLADLLQQRVNRQRALMLERMATR